ASGASLPIKNVAPCSPTMRNCVVAKAAKASTVFNEVVFRASSCAADDTARRGLQHALMSQFLQSDVVKGGFPMKPNIVVIQADQMAAQALGAYGDEAAKTPHIDALAQEGAVFDRAYCNTPLCAPSRASMMTGQLPSEVGCYDNGADFPASMPTFAHHLRAVG